MNEHIHKNEGNRIFQHQTAEMENREKIVRDYVAAYNDSNVEKMLENLDENVTFTNFEGANITLHLAGKASFKQQAEQTITLFSQRNQTIKTLSVSEDKVIVEISYTATFASDFPEGFKKGQMISLSGISEFQFDGVTIIRIIDRS